MPRVYVHIGGTIVRRALIVVGGYSMVWLRVALDHRQILELWLIGALILFDGPIFGWTRA